MPTVSELTALYGNFMLAPTPWARSVRLVL